jgi:uncharacterized membrane protein
MAEPLMAPEAEFDTASTAENSYLSQVRSRRSNLPVWMDLLRAPQGFGRVLSRLLHSVSNRWLLLVNLTTALTLLGALAAPILAILGHASASAAIHGLYLWLCPQRPGHSFFLMGQQVALEEREMSMFGAQLISGLFFGAFRDRDPLKWRLQWWWLFVASLPLAWDVISQQLGFRVSDWETRTWTGAVFSAAFVFWFYAFFDATVRGKSNATIVGSVQALVSRTGSGPGS